MKGNSKFIIIAPVLIAVSMVAGMFLGQFLHFRLGEETGNIFNIAPPNKINRVLSLIENDYVDTVNMDKLTQVAIEAILEELDPHSYYTPPAIKAAFDEEISGSFDGIGVEFNMVNDTVVVMAAIPGGPAEAVGIRSGDRIVEIEGVIVAGNKTPQDQIVKKLRGKRGTKVAIGVARRGSDKLIPFTITRDKIPLHTVDVAYMLDKNTGYIRLSRFGEKSAREMEKAIKQLKSQGMARLVLDLRGNPGGVLNGAIEIADMFLPDGRLITYTEGRARKRKSYHAYSGGVFEDGPIAVLIDEGSASASEIVSGAIQDNDRGWVIGRRSFGKGLVQEIFEMPDSSGVALTVARYYTPCGRSIQRPYDHGAEAYYLDAYKDFKTGGIPDSSAYPDSLKFETLIKKRTVYGGGGVTPDILIPIDTTQYSKFFEVVISHGYIYDFAFEWADNHREKLRKTFPGGIGFAKEHGADAMLYSQFIQFVKSKNVLVSPADAQQSRDIIIIRLKAGIARNIWGTDVYHQVLGENDPTILRAIEILSESAMP